MNPTLDHPKIRALTICPLCDKPKDPGLVVCWSCYHTHGMRYGNGPVEQHLDFLEYALIPGHEVRGKETP